MGSKGSCLKQIKLNFLKYKMAKAADDESPTAFVVLVRCPIQFGTTLFLLAPLCNRLFIHANVVIVLRFHCQFFGHFCRFNGFCLLTHVC